MKKNDNFNALKYGSFFTKCIALVFTGFYSQHKYANKRP